MRFSGVILVGLFAVAATACSSSDGGSSGTTAASGSTVASSTTTGGSTTTATGGSTADGPTTSGGPTPSTIPPPTKSILELATEEGRLGTMLGLLDTAGLTAKLQGDGPFTLIAPTDDGFKKMDPAMLDAITKNPAVLTQLLNYHLINGRVTQEDLDSGAVLTVEGTSIALHATDQFPALNGQTVIRAGRATNGTILLLDTVLLPVDLKLP